MTTINKLTIRGIRSFGIDREDDQKIEFSSPLTLIVGQNGCGKTTIIECLKYAMTGDKPPGTDNGRTFVHDPRVSKTKCTMGQVKLTVSNINGVEKTVIRSMKSEVAKGGKLKFETLDSTIRTSDPRLEKHEDISGRVEDINANMCEFMGVSKAIINNVIFCHQEDSNWPLDEGKKLKEKFDAIFGTTEYNKTINRIINIRKNYAARLAETQGEKRYCSEIKEQVEKKERILDDYRIKAAKFEKTFQQAAEDLKPLEKRKDEIMEKEKNVGRLVVKLETLKQTVTSTSYQYNNIKSKIKQELSGSIEELEKQKRDFIQIQEEKKQKAAKLEQEMNKLTCKEKEINNLEQKCKLQSEKITGQIGDMQDLSSNHFTKVRDICSKLNIPFESDLDQSLNTQQINSAFKDIKGKLADEEDGVEMMKVEAEEKDQEYQKKIDKLRVDRTKMETEIASQKSLIQTMSENRTKIKEEIKASQDSVPMLNQINPKIEKLEKKVKELSDANNVDDLKEEREIAEADRTELEDSLAQVEKDLEIFQSASRITSEFELKKNDLAKDQKEFDHIKNKQTSNLKTIFGSKMPDSSYRTTVTKKKEQLENEVKTVENQIQQAQREIDRLSERRSNLKKQMEAKSGDLKKIQDDIDDVCQGNDYPSYLAAQSEKVSKLNMDLAVLESSKNTYKDYIEKIHETPCCPICHKNFKLDEGDKVKEELEESIQILPNKIEAIQKKLLKEKKVFDKLNSFKSTYDNIDKFKNEIAKMESELKNIDKTKNETEEKKENFDCQLEEPKTLLSIMTSLFLSDVYKLDDLQRSISNKSKEVETLRSKLPKNIPDKSMAEIQADRKKLVESIKTKNDFIKKLNAEIDSYKKEVLDARENLNKLQAEKNKLQEKMQGLDRLKEELTQLEVNKTDCEKKIKESEKLLQPLKRDLESVEKEKQQSRDRSQLKIKEYEQNVNKLKIESAEIDRIENDLEKFKKMNLEQQLEEQRDLIKRHKETLKLLQEKYRIKSKEKDSIIGDIANEETTYRNIDDNIELKKIEKSKQNASDELKKMEKEIGDLDLKSMKSEKLKLIAEIEELNNNRSRITGSLGTLKQQVKDAEKELSEEKYKNAKKKYVRAMIQVGALQAIIEDLNKYRTALEKSLLKFHQDKMDQINHLLRELWNGIYSGNDIDYIMIKTDEEEETKAAASDKKRSYNYRVVQSKNGQEVDMRGRCSAGQKVLASLIIRIALADTFSLNCGILALDEPTTNLDSKNITSLCSALGRIVRERDDGTGKFMLIVITHDEEFANALERAEHYWKLSRDNRGCSRIEKCNNY